MNQQPKSKTLTRCTARLFHLAACVVFVVCIFSTSPANAVVVFVRGLSEPIVGFLDSRDANGITVLVPQPDGTFLRKIVPAIEIEDVIVTVSKERLAKLSPANPAAYREYAEELAEKKLDPEARQMGIRLFLLAAYLDPNKLGSSSLLGMTALARTPEEAKKMRALAFLLDKAHDIQILAGTPTAQPMNTRDANDQKENVLEAVKLLRSGYRSQARQVLLKDGMEAAFRANAPNLTLEQCMEIVEGRCAGCEQGNTPAYIMQKLLSTELALMPVISTENPATKKTHILWSFYIDKRFHEPLPVLTLEHLTEFDPKKSVFKNDTWTVPTP
ncbi:MAG: hypothetical protein COA78_10135 [Blastopirellula sp.]|nr:MAG: hypothetical protein COA78_10135 [Blastopirellula sp.]